MEKGLTIGGFESAFFADLVAAYILKIFTELFTDSIYNSIYRDDGINIIKGKKSVEKMCTWLVKKFQTKVNKLTGIEHIQFTLDIWNPNSPKEEKASNKNVKIHHDVSFAYLEWNYICYETN